MGDVVPLERWVDFDAWWSQPVFVDDHKEVMTRRDLILIVANQDGGSHVDPALDEAYSRLTRDNSMGWMEVLGGVQRPLPEPATASVRQMAHELLRTLEPEYRWRPAYETGIFAGGAALLSGGLPSQFTKTGRNEPCPCGSGKKFKKCHGASV